MGEEKRIVLTIAREFGSGGREIGQAVANTLGIPYLDRTLITEAAEKLGICQQTADSLDEKPTSTLLYALSTGMYPTYQAIPPAVFQSTGEALYAAQTQVIQQAAQSSCVIVGRCADYILQDDPCALHVLLHASLDYRRHRVAKMYDIPASEVTDEIRRMDKARKKYYRNYTGTNWGDLSAHHLALDTGKFSVAAARDIILAAAQALLAE